ncbi:uncharacterized protein TNCV_1228641 [Trichonephila clavipes]|nr:uncharacterized protein TNCV_1228641 [Trichonephila clavipes]
MIKRRGQHLSWNPVPKLPHQVNDGALNFHRFNEHQPLYTVINPWLVVPDRISSQRSRNFRKSPLPHASALIQIDFGCVIGVQQTKQLPHVAKVDLIRRASRPGKQFKLVIDEEPLDNACPVWSRIILLKYGCGQALKVRKDNLLQHLGVVALAV